MMTLFDSPIGAKRDAAVEDFKDRILGGIGDGWSNLFKGADDLLYTTVDTLYRRGREEWAKAIYPSSKIVMRAFRECKLENLKVVMVGQDPYHQPNIADGLAFSCANTMKEQPSLKFVFDELQKQYPDAERNPDLTRWANQGILLMNTALTVDAFSPDSHVDIWTPFMFYLFNKMNSDLKDLIYVFYGKRAKSYSALINGKENTKFHLIHPAAAAHKGGLWDSENLFTNINKTLTNQDKSIIQW